MHEFLLHKLQFWQVRFPICIITNVKRDVDLGVGGVELIADSVFPTYGTYRHSVLREEEWAKDRALWNSISRGYTL